jgi:hypothetical protein
VTSSPSKGSGVVTVNTSSPKRFDAVGLIRTERRQVLVFDRVAVGDQRSHNRLAQLDLTVVAG